MQNCARGASNRELMRVFRDVELVESLGSGMQRIMRKYTKDNFEFGDNYIRMVVPYNWVDVQEKVTGKATGKVTEKTSDKILRLITANPSITISRMMVALSMSDSGIRKVLRNLQAQGAIRRVGSDKTGHWEIIEK
ncbi:MAG: winged helix-turn-helix transcriptional regulator [Paludibacteraceae bacterium]|nr:winged helix-turn-helix transcriptional regulator [Paludibacteraceae bacterium]